MAPRNNYLVRLLSFISVRLPLCNNDTCDIYHTLSLYVMFFFGAHMRRIRLYPLNPGVTLYYCIKFQVQIYHMLRDTKKENFEIQKVKIISEFSLFCIF
jgi:hypothetical protein